MTPDSLKRFLVMAISALATLSSLFLKIDVPPEVQQAVVISISFIVSTYLYQSGKKAAEKLRLDAFRGGVMDAELIAAAEKLRANPFHPAAQGQQATPVPLPPVDRLEDREKRWQAGKCSQCDQPLGHQGLCPKPEKTP